MRRNVLKLAIAGVLVVGAAGCATEKPRQAMENKVLRVGVCPDYPPIVFKTNGVIMGVEADLAALVARKLDAKIEFVELPFDELIPSLCARKIDVVMSGLADTELRREEVRFVAPYAAVGQMVLVRGVDAKRFVMADQVYHVLRLGVLKGTTGEAFARTHVTGSNSTVTVFSEPDEALASLASREIDAFMDDAPFVLQAAKNTPALTALPWLLTDEHLAWAVPRDRAYNDLFDKLNGIVGQARRNGDLRRVINTYFEVTVKVK